MPGLPSATRRNGGAAFPKRAQDPRNEQTRQDMIARLTMIALAMAALSACAGSGGSGRDDGEVMIQQGTYTYNPNQRHAPVSLSGADLIGLEPS